MSNLPELKERFKMYVIKIHFKLAIARYAFMRQPDACFIAEFSHSMQSKKMYERQYHPEVYHTSCRCNTVSNSRFQKDHSFPLCRLKEY